MQGIVTPFKNPVMEPLKTRTRKQGANNTASSLIQRDASKFTKYKNSYIWNISWLIHLTNPLRSVRS